MPPHEVQNEALRRPSRCSERAAQLDAEGESSGQSSIWQEVYSLMRCPGPPCDLGPHCWRDPFGKRHYKLRTHHLRALIEFVEHGNTLQSHEDVPEQIREQLFKEERQRVERQPKAASCSTPFPPINITNVLPLAFIKRLHISLFSSMNCLADAFRRY
jgi:hypothetical protein